MMIACSNERSRGGWGGRRDCSCVFIEQFEDNLGKLPVSSPVDASENGTNIPTLSPFSLEPPFSGETDEDKGSRNARAEAALRISLNVPKAFSSEFSPSRSFVTPKAALLFFGRLPAKLPDLLKGGSSF